MFLERVRYLYANPGGLEQDEILLADVNMPGIKAADFLRDVKRRFPHVVTIVITGYGSIEGAVEATKMGAFDYLTKPIVDDEIRVVVEKAVRQQSLLFENQTLRNQLDLRFGLENIVGHDYKMLKIFDLVEGKEPIAFDHDCREGICGACGILVNGFAHGPARETAVCQLALRRQAVTGPPLPVVESRSQVEVDLIGFGSGDGIVVRPEK